VFKWIRQFRDAHRAQRTIEEVEWIICFTPDGDEDGEDAEIIDFFAYLEDDTEGTP